MEKQKKKKMKKPNNVRTEMLRGEREGEISSPDSLALLASERRRNKKERGEGGGKDSSRTNC